MNRDEIKKILPHREPMLLVDEVTITEGEAHGVYHVRGDEFFLQGHFPGNPVVPGVILCEIMAQACVLLVEEDMQGGATAYYASIDKVRFKKIARPGATLYTKATLKRKLGVVYIAVSEMRDETGALVCKGELSFAIPKEENA